MARNKIIIRPAMLRPVTLRRGTVVGEIRIYQELIRLAAERTRITQEHRMWDQKRQPIEGNLAALDRYRDDLFKRLGLERPGPPRPGQQKQDGGEGNQGKEQEGSEGQGSRGVMELRY